MTSQPPDTEIFGPGLARTRRKVALILWFERSLLALVPFLLWAIAFISLYLIAAPAFTLFISNSLSFLFYLGAVFLIIRGLCRLRAPRSAEIDRRIEQGNHLRHNPLSLLRDHLANPFDPVTRRLWARELSSALALTEKLKTPGPRFSWAARDQYAVRIALFLGLICAFIIAGPQWKQRVHQALVPDMSTLLYPQGSQVTLSVLPPDYTGQAEQIYEYSPSSSGGEKIKIPEGSQIEIQALARWFRPTVRIGERKILMQPEGGNSYTLTQPLLISETEPQPKLIKVQQGFVSRAEWHFEITKDSPPDLILRKPAKENPLQALILPLTLSDDYGVRTLELSVNPAEVMIDPPLGETKTYERLIRSQAGQTELSPVFDLTDHSWAGLPVRISLAAIDHKGQKSPEVSFEMILPERDFQHPIAQRLIELRKKLAWRPVHAASSVAYQIENLLMFPEEMQHDTAVYLGLQTASRRLENAPSVSTAKDTMALFWTLALKLEDGNLTLSRRALERAYQDLSAALQPPAPSEEQAREKLDNLRQKLDEYVKELSRELHKQEQDPEATPKIAPGLLDKTLDNEALARFLNQLEDSVIAGQRDKSEELLSQLRDLMDMLDPSLASPLPEDMQNMVARVNELQELIDHLRDLKFMTEDLAKTESMEPLDFPEKEVERLQERISPPTSFPPELARPKLESFPPFPVAPVPETKAPLSSKNAPDSENLPETQENSPVPVYKSREQEQKALRYILGFLMKEAGLFFNEVPPNMGEAELLLRDAERLLLEENARAAVPVQQEAIEKLQESQKEMAEQLQEMMQKNQPQMSQGPQGRDPLGRDPLGRPKQGKGRKGPFGRDRDSGLAESFVEIPEDSQKRYVEEILRTLRDKTGELNRPQYELDYLNRLLEQF